MMPNRHAVPQFEKAICTLNFEKNSDIVSYCRTKQEEIRANIVIVVINRAFTLKVSNHRAFFAAALRTNCCISN